MVLPKRPNMTRSRAGVAITTCGENMPTCASPDDRAAAAEEAPWMKISCTLLPYFSKSFASLVTHSGANCPTSLVQTTLMFAPDADPLGIESQPNKSNKTETIGILFMRSSLGAAAARTMLTSVPAYPYTSESRLDSRSRRPHAPIHCH